MRDRVGSACVHSADRAYARSKSAHTLVKISGATDLPSRHSAAADEFQRGPVLPSLAPTVRWSPPVVSNQPQTAALRIRLQLPLTSDQSPFDLLLLDGQLDPGVLPRSVLKLPTVVFVASRRRAACCDDEQCDGSNIAYPGHGQKLQIRSVAVVGMIVQLVRSTIASRSYVTIRWWHAWVTPLEGWSRDGLSKPSAPPILYKTKHLRLLANLGGNHPAPFLSTLT